MTANKPFSVLRSFLAHEAASGYVLMVAAALALAGANSPYADTYFSMLQLPIGGSFGGVAFKSTAQHVINDGLMAIFFLLVGLEIKREILDGQLKGWNRIALPGIAAMGGMLVPALIYFAINADNAAGSRGWAIPSATDIAFALGVLALLGRRVPASLKIFLTALAIIDDLGAIVIIAAAYTTDLNIMALTCALLVVVSLVVLNRLGVRILLPYLMLGVLLWVFVLQSGVHATLSGVVLALTIPLRRTHAAPDDLAVSPLHRLEHALQTPVGFIIIPLFGFANAGLSFREVGIGQVIDPIPLGVAAGLFLGKQIGVFSFAWAAIATGLAERPRHATLLQMYGVAILCGIGFTMSLFIGNLAFSRPLLLDEMRLGVLSGSLLSAITGLALLSWAAAREVER